MKIKTWVLLPALLCVQVAVGAPALTGMKDTVASQEEPDLAKDLYWICGARPRLEFGEAVGDFETQTVMLTEAVNWFRFRLDDGMNKAAENLIAALEEGRVPESLILRILEVRIQELPKEKEEKFAKKRLVALVQYIPVWMTAQGKW